MNTPTLGGPSRNLVGLVGNTGDDNTDVERVDNDDHFCDEGVRRSDDEISYNQEDNFDESETLNDGDGAADIVFDTTAELIAPLHELMAQKSAKNPKKPKNSKVKPTMPNTKDKPTDTMDAATDTKASAHPVTTVASVIGSNNIQAYLNAGVPLKNRAVDPFRSTMNQVIQQLRRKWG